MKYILLLFSVTLFLSVCSCSDDCDCTEIDTKNAERDSTSTVLIELIKSRSNSGDLSHFIIPDYNDYAAIPQDPNNPITAEKVELGMMLYHDPAAGITPAYEENYQTYSCASCHPAECEYQPGIAQGVGEGGWGFGAMGEERILDPQTPLEHYDVQSLKTPSAMNMAFAPNGLWDGKLGARGWNEGTEDLWGEFPAEANHLGYDGLETQAIVGLKVHRVNFNPAWVLEYNYKPYFDAAYPDIPEEERYTSLYGSLAIAAYERTMTSCRAPFQEYLRGDDNALTSAQKEGAMLFFGQGNCVSCHNGTALANIDRLFCIGLNDMDENNGVRTAPQLGRGGFTGNELDNYKFKVPQLYNLKGVGFYGHGSSMSSLRAMVDYCAKGVPENPIIPSYQISSLFTDRGLTKIQLDYLDDFIRNALYDPEIKRHKPSFVASEFCFPNADPQSIVDHGCN